MAVSSLALTVSDSSNVPVDAGPRLEELLTRAAGARSPGRSRQTASAERVYPGDRWYVGRCG
jgi:hypothetical protein